ncbi:suppressor of rasval19, partial [Coemansia sp. 'formosensis']
MADIGMFAVCGSLGQCFVFYTLAKFGSLTLTTVTVTRKFLTILISVFYNGHPLNSRQWSATGIVFSGIALDVYMKQTSKKPLAKTIVLDDKPIDTDEMKDAHQLDALEKLAKVDMVSPAELQASIDRKIDNIPATRHAIRRRQQLVELLMTTSTDLQSLLRRIEKATTRLEELATKRAETAAVSGSTSSSVDITTPNAGADNKVVLEYEATVQPQIAKFVSYSDKIGGVVVEQARLVEALYQAQRSFLRIATLTKKPTMDQLPGLLGPQQSAIQQIISLREANRASEYFDNLSTIAEGIAAFGWVAVEPTPVPYINDMKDSAQFYANRVLKKWREKDENQVEWVKAFLGTLRELSAYVKLFHTTGLVWNPKGEDVEVAARAINGEVAAAAPVRGAGAPPPPPPPPPPVYVESGEVDGSAGTTTRGALFADLNKGGDITSGLRKVEATQMTHKNPALRAAGS